MELEPDAFMDGGPLLWEKLGINERCCGIMSKALSSGRVDRELDTCHNLGVKIATCRDSIYPHALSELRDAPLLLYIRGKNFISPAHAVGVVGTRRCSSYGSTVAREIGSQSARRGLGVVSGGAKGIDGAAHGGCLECGGITAAVLGTGVNMVYPSEHRTLFDRIMESGALYSEYPLGTGGEAWRFPKRNRIIVGLSSRTVIVEAPNKSGAMITARIAAEAGRDVWAVPGRINDERCSGSNRLIFDGAIPLIDTETFFGESGFKNTQRNLFEDDASEEGPETTRPAPLSETEAVLAALLANQGDRTIDNLAGEAKMSAAEVFKIISIMSLRGLVYLSGPGRYRLAD
jgi:DNA processing protein